MRDVYTSNKAGKWGYFLFVESKRPCNKRKSDFLLGPPSGSSSSRATPGCLVSRVPLTEQAGPPRYQCGAKWVRQVLVQCSSLCHNAKQVRHLTGLFVSRKSVVMPSQTLLSSEFLDVASSTCTHKHILILSTHEANEFPFCSRQHIAEKGEFFLLFHRISHS